MKRSDHCIICNKSGLVEVSGRLAPFISHYVFDGSVTSANFCLCHSCQMMFSSVRFDEHEMQRLYADYRGERYCSTREKFEPGYSALNSQLGASDIEVRNRIAFCESLLEWYPGRIGSVLDYGGDRGQFIPLTLSHADRYVFDLSGVKPLEGIVSLSAPAEKAPYDLVMCCHVLEHQPWPMNTLRELRSIVSSQGAVYIEVPAGIPTRRYFEATLASSALCSTKTPVMHEHINYFTKCSLRNSLLMSGFRPVISRLSIINLGRSVMPILACLAVSAPAQPIPSYGRLSMLFEGCEYAIRRNLFAN